MTTGASIEIDKQFDSVESDVLIWPLLVLCSLSFGGLVFLSHDSVFGGMWIRTATEKRFQ
jgi:hypothetical protein